MLMLESAQGLHSQGHGHLGAPSEGRAQRRDEPRVPCGAAPMPPGGPAEPGARPAGDVPDGCNPWVFGVGAPVVGTL